MSWCDCAEARAGRDRARQAQADRNLDAYDCFLRGMASMYELTRNSCEEAIRLPTPRSVGRHHQGRSLEIFCIFSGVRCRCMGGWSAGRGWCVFDRPVGVVPGVGALRPTLACQSVASNWTPPSPKAALNAALLATRLDEDVACVACAVRFPAAIPLDAATYWSRVD